MTVQHFWIPDSCNCKLEYSEAGNDPTKFIRFVRRCKLHAVETVNDITAENQSFNSAAKTEIQIREDKRLAYESSL